VSDSHGDGGGNGADDGDGVGGHGQHLEYRIYLLVLKSSVYYPVGFDGRLGGTAGGKRSKPIPVTGRGGL
jgi:hypothetical protein